VVEAVRTTGSRPALPMKWQVHLPTLDKTRTTLALLVDKRTSAMTKDEKGCCGDHDCGSDLLPANNSALSLSHCAIGLCAATLTPRQLVTVARGDVRLPPVISAVLGRVPPALR
jgi:hypothetical protein